MQKALRKNTQPHKLTWRTEQILVRQYAPEQYVQNEGTIFIYEQYEDTRKISEDVRTELLNRRKKKKLEHRRSTWNSKNK